jgi:hypothetical protein
MNGRNTGCPVMMRIRFIGRKRFAFVFHSISKRLVGIYATARHSAKANERLEI